MPGQNRTYEEARKEAVEHITIHGFRSYFDRYVVDGIMSKPLPILTLQDSQEYVKARENRRYDISDRLYEEHLGKHLSEDYENLQRYKGYADGYNDAMEQKLANGDPIYRSLRKAELKQMRRDKTFQDCIEENGGKQCYSGNEETKNGILIGRSKSFTLDINHPYSKRPGNFTVSVNSTKFPLQVLKITPYERKDKTLENGQQMTLDSIEQLELRMRTDTPVPIPDGAILEIIPSYTVR